MSLRDELEAVLRRWNNYELARNAPAVIDFDLNPPILQASREPFDRLSAYWELLSIYEAAPDTTIGERANTHLTYLRALLGERLPLNDYVLATQGCRADGWSELYIRHAGEIARSHLEALGIRWGPGTRADLASIEQVIDPRDASDAIEQATRELEPAVREATGATAAYTLRIETTTINAYWDYWTDGIGQDVRVRLNMKRAQFTKVQARQFALHEVLGHGLQGASYAQRCKEAGELVPWIRLLSVHAPQQVLLEGLAQALPLFITPDDKLLVTRVRLDHYTQLVRAAIHISLNAGESAESCARYAQRHVPYWSNEDIADLLTDRSTDPLLRSYLWAYPAGIDWFVNLADTKPANTPQILRATYQDPLTPDQLTELWPSGPVIGGEGQGR